MSRDDERASWEFPGSHLRAGREPNLTAASGRRPARSGRNALALVWSPPGGTGSIPREYRRDLPPAWLRVIWATRADDRPVLASAGEPRGHAELCPFRAGAATGTGAGNGNGLGHVRDEGVPDPFVLPRKPRADRSQRAQQFLALFGSERLGPEPDGAGEPGRVRTDGAQHRFGTQRLVMDVARHDPPWRIIRDRFGFADISAGARHGRARVDDQHTAHSGRGSRLLISTFNGFVIAGDVGRVVEELPHLGARPVDDDRR